MSAVTSVGATLEVQGASRNAVACGLGWSIIVSGVGHIVIDSRKRRASAGDDRRQSRNGIRGFGSARGDIINAAPAKVERAGQYGSPLLIVLMPFVQFAKSTACMPSTLIRSTRLMRFWSWSWSCSLPEKLSWATAAPAEKASARERTAIVFSYCLR